MDTAVSSSPGVIHSDSPSAIINKRGLQHHFHHYHIYILLEAIILMTLRGVAQYQC